VFNSRVIEFAILQLSVCVKYNGGVWDYGRMIIDQENPAAESNGLFFNKTNQFESIRPKRIGKLLRIGML